MILMPEINDISTRDGAGTRVDLEFNIKLSKVRLELCMSGER